MSEGPTARDKIAALRAQGYKQPSIARALDVNTSLISQIERGKKGSSLGSRVNQGLDQLLGRGEITQDLPEKSSRGRKPRVRTQTGFVVERKTNNAIWNALREGKNRGLQAKVKIQADRVIIGESYGTRKYPKGIVELYGKSYAAGKVLQEAREAAGRAGRPGDDLQAGLMQLAREREGIAGIEGFQRAIITVGDWEEVTEDQRIEGG